MKHTFLFGSVLDIHSGASLVAQMVENSPANAGDVRDEGLIPGLGKFPGGGHDNPSSILAWRIPWKEESGGLQSMGSQSQTQLRG